MNPHIVFVFPPAASFADRYISTNFNMCLGSAYIITYLVREGFLALPFLTAEPVSIGEAAARVAAMKPRIVGFTVYDTNFAICQLMARALKEILPPLIILFGGPVPSVQADTILTTDTTVDICVRNEGEETCLELLSLLVQADFDLDKASASLDKVKGIHYRSGDCILANPDRDLVPSGRTVDGLLDRFPSPYLSGMLKSPKLGILTARGCDRNCVYCNCAVMSKRIIATHSMDRVIAELAHLSRWIKHHSSTNVVIYDDAFTLIPERALALCRKITENKLELPLVCTTRCDMVSEELLEAMKEAGFISVGFSLESAIPHILRRIGKVRHPNTAVDDDFEKEKEFIENFKKYILYAKKIGIANVFTSIIVGLPGETLEEGQQTVNFIASLQDQLDYYAHNVFKIYAGTPIYYQYRNHGLRLQAYDNRVQSRTIHSYDTRKIRLAPKSNLEVDSINQDKENIKILALTPERKHQRNYFDKVILCADRVTGDLVTWLGDCLAVNGPMIQIYSNLERARQYYEDNEKALKTYASPTTAYTGYYRERREDGLVNLVPFRKQIYGEQCGLTLHLIDTGLALSSSPPGGNPLQSMAMDREEADVFRLHRLLTELATADDVIANLLYTPLYPYLSSLCRWERTVANCTTLETAIIDPDFNIKTCWQGTPLGKVGAPFPEIAATLKRYRLAARKTRGCGNCEASPTCMQCLFPGPLSLEGYCRLKTTVNTAEIAGMIREFDLFKAL